jgi:hypothetical protein
MVKLYAIYPCSHFPWVSVSAALPPLHRILKCLAESSCVLMRQSSCWDLCVVKIVPLFFMFYSHGKMNGSDTGQQISRGETIHASVPLLLLLCKKLGSHDHIPLYVALAWQTDIYFIEIQLLLYTLKCTIFLVTVKCPHCDEWFWGVWLLGCDVI